MAVAEKSTQKTSAQNPVQQLALASFAGAAYLLLTVGLVFSIIPTLWEMLGIEQAIDNPYLSTTLVIILSALAGVGLLWLGRKLEGSHPLRGLRAGAVLAALTLQLAFIICMDWIGSSLVNRGVEAFVAWTVIVVIMGLVLAGLYWIYNRAGFAKYLVSLEEKGWFHANSFKFNQGQKIRRITLVTLLIVVGFGLYNHMRSGGFGRGTWTVPLAGTDYLLVLLYNVEYTLTLILFVLLAWFCWRLVNWPTFADFLIATEAEMNKVSWTTRKRLIQDTIVVLVTLLLLTVFLFVVDILWIRVLSFEPIPGVLKINPQAARAKQLAPTDW